MFVFFFNDTATTEIYTLSLHDALPISHDAGAGAGERLSGRREGRAPEVLPHVAATGRGAARERRRLQRPAQDRKSTRLNSSHLVISYAVFCLKTKRPPSSSPSYRPGPV